METEQKRPDKSRKIDLGKTSSHNSKPVTGKQNNKNSSNLPKIKKSQKGKESETSLPKQGTKGPSSNAPTKNKEKTENNQGVNKAVPNKDGSKKQARKRNKKPTNSSVQPSALSDIVNEGTGEPEKNNEQVISQVINKEEEIKIQNASGCKKVGSEISKSKKRRIRKKRLLESLGISIVNSVNTDKSKNSKKKKKKKKSKFVNSPELSSENILNESASVKSANFNEIVANDAVKRSKDSSHNNCVKKGAIKKLESTAEPTSKASDINVSCIKRKPEVLKTKSEKKVSETKPTVCKGSKDVLDNSVPAKIYSGQQETQHFRKPDKELPQPEAKNSLEGTSQKLVNKNKDDSTTSSGKVDLVNFLSHDNVEGLFRSALLNDVTLSSRCSEKEVKNFFNTYGTFSERGRTQFATVEKLLNSSNKDSEELATSQYFEQSLDKEISPSLTSKNVSTSSNKEGSCEVNTLPITSITTPKCEYLSPKIIKDSINTEDPLRESPDRNSESELSCNQIVRGLNADSVGNNSIFKGSLCKGPIYTSPNLENRVTSSSDSGQIPSSTSRVFVSNTFKLHELNNQDNFSNSQGVYEQKKSKQKGLSVLENQSFLGESSRSNDTQAKDLSKEKSKDIEKNFKENNSSQVNVESSRTKKAEERISAPLHSAVNLHSSVSTNTEIASGNDKKDIKDTCIEGKDKSKKRAWVDNKKDKTVEKNDTGVKTVKHSHTNHKDDTGIDTTSSDEKDIFIKKSDPENRKESSIKKSCIDDKKSISKKNKGVNENSSFCHDKKESTDLKKNISEKQDLKNDNTANQKGESIDKTYRNKTEQSITNTYNEHKQGTVIKKISTEDKRDLNRKDFCTNGKDISATKEIENSFYPEEKDTCTSAEEETKDFCPDKKDESLNNTCSHEINVNSVNNTYTPLKDIIARETICANTVVECAIKDISASKTDLYAETCIDKNEKSLVKSISSDKKDDSIKEKDTCTNKNSKTVVKDISSEKNNTFAVKDTCIEKNRTSVNDIYTDKGNISVANIACIDKKDANAIKENFTDKKDTCALKEISTDEKDICSNKKHTRAVKEICTDKKDFSIVKDSNIDRKDISGVKKICTDKKNSISKQDIYTDGKASNGIKESCADGDPSIKDNSTKKRGSSGLKDSSADNKNETSIKSICSYEKDVSITNTSVNSGNGESVKKVSSVSKKNTQIQEISNVNEDISSSKLEVNNKPESECSWVTCNPESNEGINKTGINFNKTTEPLNLFNKVEKVNYSQVPIEEGNSANKYKLGDISCLGNNLSDITEKEKEVKSDCDIIDNTETTVPANPILNTSDINLLEDNLTMKSSQVKPGVGGNTPKTEKTREEILAEREAKKAAKLAAKNKTKVSSSVVLKTEILTKNTSSADRSAKQEKSSTDAKVSKLPELTEAVPKIKQAIKTEDLNLSNKTNKTHEKVVSKDDIQSTAESTTEKTEAASEKSKAELRAERRAKQEAQRAAKAAQQQTKTVQGKPIAQVPAAPKEKLPQKEIGDDVIKKSTKISAPAMKLKTPEHRVKLFNHLYHERGPLSISETSMLSGPDLHPAIVKLGMQYADRLVVGSNARCIGLLDALKQVIRDYETPPQKEFSRGLEAELQPSVAFLETCRPLSVSMTNALRYLMRQLTQLPNNVSDSEAKKKLLDVIDTYIREQIDMAAQAICIMVQRKIANGDVILTYGCSSLVQRILLETHASGTKFKVIVVDGRPWNEGREMLRRLTEHGLDCSYVLVSAASFIMREATKVLLGAHALLANGYVMSRAGSSQVALLAHSYNVPVLICCETHKFCERVQTDSFVYNELGNPDDLIPATASLKEMPLSKWKSIGSLTPLNLTYDVTPPDLVSAVVTELGILPCTSVPVILRIKPSEIGC